MTRYNVIVADSVVKFLDKADHGEKLRITKRLEKLEENPYGVGEPRGKFWILKIGRAGYRVAYVISEHEKMVRVTAIEKRKSRKYRDFYD